jgi:hypothetical protein
MATTRRDATRALRDATDDASTMRARRVANGATRDTLGRFVRDALRRADAERAAVTTTGASGTRARDEWTYGELLDRALTFARALEDLGYDASSRPLGVGTGNARESVVAYLGTALAGTSARGARATDDLRETFGDGRTRGTMVRREDAETAGGLIGAHEPIAVGGGTVRDKVILWEVLRAAYANGETASDARETANDAMYYFGGADAPVGGMTFADAATRAVRALEIRETDSVCVPVPLGHAMGFGFGALAAFAAGARLVLPPTIGSAADGAAAREAMCAATLDAIRSEKCTLAVVDSHVTRAAAERDLGADAGYDHFRGGLIKVGSGDAIGVAESVKFLGAELLTVGKPKKT